MKKFRSLIIAVLLTVSAMFRLSAQDIVVPAGYYLADSLVFSKVALLDSSLVGRNIFSVLPQNVGVVQTDRALNAIEGRIAANGSAEFQGYRIRIYFNNSQKARGESTAALYRFKTLHPEIAAYRTFDNPNFKVTVGDFRTRSEALAALRYIQNEFPSAFVVREKFKFPSISGEEGFRIDTLKVMKRL